MMKILYIDSDETSFFVIKKYFSLSGLQPHWLQSLTGSGALTYLQGRKEMPDLILLDPVLPDMYPDEIFHALDVLQVFVKTAVGILTTFLGEELDRLGSGYPIFKKFAKPMQKHYVNELASYANHYQPEYTK